MSPRQVPQRGNTTIAQAEKKIPINLVENHRHSKLMVPLPLYAMQEMDRPTSGRSNKSNITKESKITAMVKRASVYHGVIPTKRFTL